MLIEYRIENYLLHEKNSQQYKIFPFTNLRFTSRFDFVRMSPNFFLMKDTQLSFTF